MKPCSILLVLFLFPMIGFTQSTGATISGGVTDPAGKFIVEATVEIKNDATGVVYSSRTNGSGMYLVPILPPGHYHVQVSKQGFTTVIKADVILNVQGALALNFTLPVGAASESVTVGAGSNEINTTDASVSTVVDQKFVANLPLNGRSLQDLILMTPGIVTQSPQNSGQTVGYNGDFSVNGQRTESNYYTVDGLAANSSPGNGYGTSGPGNGGSLGSSTALGTTQSLVPIDALEEFRVQSSTYSAEFGRSPGGQFSMSTRSGTNIVHGTAFDYLRNDAFDANDWFNDYFGRANTALRQNDFGGTLGGPILIPHIYSGRNRTFLFASYEGLRLTQPQAASAEYVPDTFMRQEAPGALQPILNAFPIQNGVDYGDAANPSLAEFIAPYSLPSQIDSISLRLDHSFNSKLMGFFRYAHTPSSTSTRNLSVIQQNRFENDTYALGSTWQIVSNTTNDFRLGYSAATSEVVQNLDSFGGAVPVDLRQETGLGGYPSSNPEMFIEIAGVGYGYVEQATSKNKLHQWNLIDTLALASGRHSIKFGIDYRRIVSPLVPTSPYVSAFYFSGSQVLANNSDFLDIGKQIPTTPQFNEFAAFAQDDWRLRPHFSLSAGLRWEVNPPPTAADGNYPYTVEGNINQPQTLTLAPKGTPIWKTPWFNFAPRLGIAWTVQSQPGWETVLRTGAGVFFDTDNQLAVSGFTALGYVATNIAASAPLPVTPAQLDFEPNANPPYTSAAVYAFPTHLQLPFTWQWNVSLEQGLGPNQSFIAGYVGSNGRRLGQLQQMSVSSLNSNFDSVDYVPNGATSNYQALQLQYKRYLRHGLQALASYTWSHSIDFGSNNLSYALTRSSSDFDLRHNVQAGASWDLPNASKSNLIGIVVSHWGLDGRFSARTGFPITLDGNLQTDPSSGHQYYSGLNFDSTMPAYVYGLQNPGGRALNKAAFSLPTGDQTGNAPRNFVRSFTASQVNLALRRQFHVHDRLNLQFRAESFNLLNRPNFGYVDPIYTDSTFGQATNMLNASLGTMAAEYQQGGARSMQFALKVVF
jgi:Carboxypeptidase regulatory-like domain/TonB-dependent Receptor Plug Domain